MKFGQKLKKNVLFICLGIFVLIYPQQNEELAPPDLNRDNALMHYRIEDLPDPHEDISDLSESPLITPDASQEDEEQPHNNQAVQQDIAFARQFEHGRLQLHEEQAIVQQSRWRTALEYIGAVLNNPAAPLIGLIIMHYTFGDSLSHKSRLHRYKKPVNKQIKPVLAQATLANFLQKGYGALRKDGQSYSTYVYMPCFAAISLFGKGVIPVVEKMVRKTNFGKKLTKRYRELYEEQSPQRKKQIKIAKYAYKFAQDAVLAHMLASVLIGKPAATQEQ